MKLNLKTKIVAAALLLNATLFAQQTFITTPNYKFNTTSTSLVGSPLIPGGTQGTYPVANGCYDNNNNLLFYVTNAGIYSPAGSFVGALGYAGVDFCGSRCTYYSQVANSEFVIAPIPGTCKQFYVFYNMGYCPTGSVKNCYIKVDCSGATPIIGYNGLTPTVKLCDLPPTNAAFETGITTSGGSNIGMAMSKIVSGSGASAVRYLYTVSTNGVMVLTVSSSGVSASTTMPFTVNGIGGANYFNPSEVELSPDGNWLAWNDLGATGTGTTKVLVGKLNGQYGTSFNTGTGLQWGTSEKKMAKPLINGYD